MKNTMLKVWGIVLTLAILAGLLVAAVPVSAANLAWTANGLPVTTTTATATWLFSVGADGKTMLAYDQTNFKLYKSVDGGVTFTTATTANGIDGKVLTAMKLAADNVTAIATDGTDVFASSNAGTSWSTFTPAGYTAITAVDVAAGPILLAGGDAGYSIYKTGGTFSGGWSTPKVAGTLSDLTGQTILAIALSPNYATDNLIALVTSDANNTYVRFIFGTRPVGEQYVDQVITGASTAATIAFPSDFNAGTNGNFLVGSTVGLYKIALAPYANAPANVGASAKLSANAISSLSLKGTWAAGTAFYTDTAVRRLANVGGLTSTTAVPAGSTNVTGLAPIVAATADKVFVLTGGIGGALNVSTDGAAYVQTNLIQAASFAIGSVTFVDANTIFLVANDGTNDGIYKSIDAGATWQRIQYGSDVASVYASPTFATDNTIYVTTGSSLTWKSVDGGKTLSPFIAADAITSMALVDANTYYYVAGGSIYKSTALFTPLAGATNVYSLNYVNATNIYAGGTDGKVYKSVDGATFATVITAAPFTAGNVVVAADAANVYVASDVADAGVKKLAGTTWVPAGTGILAGATVTALALNADGTLYVIDTANDKVMRNADGAAFEDMVYPNAGAAASKIIGNTIYVVGAAKMSNFTDTLSAAPVITSPGKDAAALLDVKNAKLTWTPVVGATAYAWKLSTTQDMKTNVIGSSDNTPVTTVFLPSAAQGGLLNGETYYVSVQVVAPFHSKVSAAVAFQTKLTSLGTDLSAKAPAAGATVSQKSPTFAWTSVANATSYDFKLSDKADFSTTVDSTIGLTSTVYTTGVVLKEGTTYYWEVRAVNGTNASDWVQSTFSIAVPPAPVTTSTPVINLPTPIVNVPAPTVVVNNPTPVVTVTPSAQTTPPWVWVIIAIGAVLVVAVVVLIARTRRV